MYERNLSQLQQQLRRRADSAARRSGVADSRARYRKAHKHIVAACDALERAVQIADDADDVSKLASVMYRRARLANRLGLGEDAIASARRSAALYEQFDYTRGDPGKVAGAFETPESPLLMLNHATGGVVGFSSDELTRGRARFIKRHAESRRLLAWCLAKYGPPGSEIESRDLGSRSLETVRELHRAGAYTSAIEVASAAVEYDEILRALAERGT
jgi:tetratricopeptide (TPR) repeat protein